MEMERIEKKKKKMLTKNCQKLENTYQVILANKYRF